MFINLTPHALTVHLPGGETATFPPSGRVARVADNGEPADAFEGVPTVRRGTIDIPWSGGDELCIVPNAVLDAAAAQDHPMLDRLVAPDIGPTAIRWTRDDAAAGACSESQVGQVRAVTRLVRATRV